MPKSVSDKPEIVNVSSSSGSRRLSSTVTRDRHSVTGIAVADRVSSSVPEISDPPIQGKGLRDKHS